MYRVAVIQNESEMLRSGYANVIKKLKQISSFNNYSFELFNIVNIKKLFEIGDSYINNYDCLIITTNATSDKDVLEILIKNKKTIESYIFSGKGIFIGSQKKLSTKKFRRGEDSGKSGFLPDIYDFYTVERPKKEKDSGKGEIFISKKNELLLNYPKPVTKNDITNKCITNDFREHFYRSHIVENRIGVFKSILYDNSYKKAKNRNLLVANLLPQKDERVIISTIAIDWEFHENLLINIIKYLTEGLPKIAFVGNNQGKGDFDFILSSAKISKIPYIIYQSLNCIKKELTNIHNTYVFSPSYDKKEIETFLGDTNKNKNYITAYYFQNNNSLLTLSQYTNFNTIDLIIDSSILWIDSKFNNKMWNNSFWTTHDILHMYIGLNKPIDQYINYILKDIKNHYSSNSYDSVLGATCGLLELINNIKENNREAFEKEFSDKDITLIQDWILEKFNSSSSYDKNLIFLTLNKVLKDKTIDKLIEKHILINLDELTKQSMITNSDSESDICLNIELLIRVGKNKEKIVYWVNQLLTKQSFSGSWTNVGRTSHVLLTLLKHYDILVNKFDINLDDSIYNGIYYLRTEFNWEESNWDNDIQATSKSIYAIGLYNNLFKNSTQNFLKTLESDIDQMYSARIVNDVADKMISLRYNLNENIIENRKIKDKLHKDKKDNEYLYKTLEDAKEYEKIQEKEVKKAKTLSVIFGTMLVGILFYLYSKYPEALIKELLNLNITDALIGFIIGLLLTGMIESSTIKKKIFKKKKEK